MRALLAAALLLASPVAAQDVATDFSDTYARIYGDHAPEPRAARLHGLSTLDTIDGTWIDAALVMHGPTFDPALAAEACSFIHTVITRHGSFGFTTQTSRSGALLTDTRTYIFYSGNYFTFTTDLDGIATRLFGERNPATLEPHILDSTILTPSASGLARVELTGTDVLMIDSPTANPQILTRCP